MIKYIVLKTVVWEKSTALMTVVDTKEDAITKVKTLYEEDFTKEKLMYSAKGKKFTTNFEEFMSTLERENEYFYSYVQINI